MHISPMMPLPYSMNARQVRGWTSRWHAAASAPGPNPHFVIEVLRRLAIRRILRRAHVVVAVDFDVADLAELARLDDVVAGVDEMRRAAPLRADLDDALVLARGGDHRLTFDDVDTDRFLHVDVGAGFNGGDHCQGVPVIGRGNLDDVEIFFLEHLAVVGIGARLLLRLLPRGRRCRHLGEHCPIDVAQRDDFDWRDLNESEQVGFAVPAAADETDAQRFHVGEGFEVTAGGQRESGSGAGVKELTTVHGCGLRERASECDGRRGSGKRCFATCGSRIRCPWFFSFQEIRSLSNPSPQRVLVFKVFRLPALVFRILPLPRFLGYLLCNTLTSTARRCFLHTFTPHNLCSLGSELKAFIPLAHSRVPAPVPDQPLLDSWLRHGGMAAMTIL